MPTWTGTATREHRPFIKVKAGGDIYILVHTRRGIRARQVTAQGKAWIWRKYPVNDYPMPDDVPLTYADYGELRRLGFVYTGNGGTPSPAPAPIREMPRVVRPSAPISPALAPAGPTDCRGCGKALRADACFCPRCGRVSPLATREKLTGAASARSSPTPIASGWVIPLPIVRNKKQHALIAAGIIAAIAFIAILAACRHTPAQPASLPDWQMAPVVTDYANPPADPDREIGTEPRTIYLSGYHRRDGTFIRGHYQSK
jgi:hypothetical protein